MSKKKHSISKKEEGDSQKKITIALPLIALGVSILFHFTFMFSHLKHNLKKKEATKKQNKIKLVLRPSKDIEKIKKLQIVDSENTGRKEKPKDSAFLSKINQTFDRETTAKKIGSFKKAGKGINKGILKPVPKIKKIVKHDTKEKEKSQAKKNQKNKKFNKKISLNDLSLGSAKVKKKQKALKQLAALGIKNGIKDRTGLSQSNDFVEEIPLGDMTNLNTVEYKYYGFYHRIKQKLEQYWGNSLREKAERLWRSGRRIPASENRITSLLITIDNIGNIIKIHVKGTSGVRELDDAAIESFNKAGPFPNPPKGMMKNGMAKIEWGFVVKS